MKDTKSSIIFIVLSVVLLIGISLLPDSSPVSAGTTPMRTMTTVVPTPISAVGTRSSYLAPESETPFAYTVTVKEY